VIILRNLFFVLAVSVAGQFSAMSAQPEPLQISWEIERGLRYFRYPSDFEFQRLAYKDFKTKHGGKEPTIEELDAKLNDYDWWSKPEISPDVLKWYGVMHPLRSEQVLKQWRAKEIHPDNNSKDKRYHGYLELASELNDRGAEGWEYHPARIGWASLLFPAHYDGDVERVIINDGENSTYYYNLTEDAKESVTEATKVAVCWNRVDRSHSNCGDDYIEPRTHNVIVRAIDRPDHRLVDGICEWKIEGENSARFVLNTEPPNKTYIASCAVKVTIKVPYRETTDIRLTRRMPSNASSEASAKIDVKDILVVGVGDSFSSGEGNPDVPVKLAWGLSPPPDPDNNLQLQNPRTIDWLSGPPPYFDLSTHAPVRKNDGEYFAAQWVDRSCHRSAYSYQLRAALHLALADPHRAVTFLGYACSGAEVNPGLFFPWKGPEQPRNDDEVPSWKKAQFPLLLKELCKEYDESRVANELNYKDEERLIDDNQYSFSRSDGAIRDQAYRCRNATLGNGFKRKIDLLYISIGGNDLGFSSWIVAALTKQSAWDRLEAFLPASDVIDGLKKHLTARYGLLREFIDQRLSFVDRGVKPVIFYTYPVTYQGLNGRDCPGGNSGLTIFGEGIRFFPLIWTSVCLQHPLTTISQAANNLNEQIVALAKRQPDIGTQKHPEWVAVNKYATRFNKRGFCSSKLSQEPNNACMDIHGAYQMVLRLNYCGKSSAKETLHLPMKTSLSHAETCSEWRPYDPILDLVPYAHRSRLYRTMNDVYLIVNQMSRNSQVDRYIGLLDLQTAAKSGAFHPTAEAHAIIADEFFLESSEILKRPEVQ
jgi:hypothetical protein